MLLNTPRLDRRSLRFLDLSEVRRVVAESDVEETQTSSLDRCIVWQADEMVAG